MRVAGDVTSPPSVPGMATQQTSYGIGDLARNAGLTVRTLR